MHEEREKQGAKGKYRDGVNVFCVYRKNETNRFKCIWVVFLGVYLCLRLGECECVCVFVSESERVKDAQSKEEVDAQVQSTRCEPERSVEKESGGGERGICIARHV